MNIHRLRFYGWSGTAFGLAAFAVLGALLPIPDGATAEDMALGVRLFATGAVLAACFAIGNLYR